MNQLIIDWQGQLTLTLGTREVIHASPVGILYWNGTAFLPVSALIDGDVVHLHYGCGEATLCVTDCGGYHKLTVLSVPEGSQSFIFGPYDTDGTTLGEILGVSWLEDGAAACIQSLMPKVEGGIRKSPAQNSTGMELTPCKAAARRNGRITLQCSISDRTKQTLVDAVEAIPGYDQHIQSIARPIPGPDALIEGASIALIAANSSDALLDVICDMELAEGLPHSLYDGQWAKKNKRATAIYMIFSGEGLSAQERIAMAQRAGINCVYLSDMLRDWGHFTIDKNAYPGGTAEIKALSDMAAQSGLTLGTHTLSNFITTGDAYVTPVPHDGLLVMDETVLTRDITDTDTELAVQDENNFAIDTALNTLRIGDELITYAAYDPQNRLLTGCIRGAFGTTASAHAANAPVSRLWDHGYRTLFPDLTLQNDMADNLSRTLLDCGVTRMSFDGLEGCYYPGAGEYGPAEFVRRIFRNTKNGIICDASITGHYLWHALSYCNWGEPWWDSARRGGMHTRRANTQAFFRRNLLPGMFGWFRIFSNTGKYEATSPENMEFMLSRSAAFDAGLAVYIETATVREHGLMDQYLDLIRLWEDFRFHADLPDAVRAQLQEEQSNWHLESTDGGWLLTSLAVRTLDMDYCDRDVSTEAGMIYQTGANTTDSNLRFHCTTMELDEPADCREETLHFRIRVGRPGHGRMYGLKLATLDFRFDAGNGDYLEYRGGTQLYHYDCNYNLLAVYDCDGQPICWSDGILYTQCHYITDTDDMAEYLFTEIRAKKIYQIARK